MTLRARALAFAEIVLIGKCQEYVDIAEFWPIRFLRKLRRRNPQERTDIIMASEGKSRAAGPIKRGAFQLNLVASYEQSFPSFYSNYAVVSNTPTELCIDLCVLAPPHKINVEKKTTSVPVVARVLIPASMARGLVKALESQIQKHEAVRKSNIIAVERKEQ